MEIIFANKAELTESELHALIEIIKAIGALVVFIFVMIRRKKRLKKEAADKKKMEDMQQEIDRLRREQY
jgi:hypothetical protein